MCSGRAGKTAISTLDFTGRFEQKWLPGDNTEPTA
jgi:hypothetical protein